MAKPDGFLIPAHTQFRELSGLVLERYEKHYQKGNRGFIVDLLHAIGCFYDRRPVPAKLAKSVAFSFFCDTHEELERWMKEHRVSERIPKQHHGHMAYVFWELAEAVSKRLTDDMRVSLVKEAGQVKK